MGSISNRISDLLTRHAAALRQTFRVTIATAAAYAAYKALGLQQGYWAVFTVLIVIQGSIGGTLGAASDRMIGTLAGALLGGVAAAFHTGTALGQGMALLVVTAVAVLGAALYSQLRIAPVTAAIMLLSQPPGVAVGDFVVDRVIEIGLGGVIGVLATVFILPARSHEIVVERAIAVLRRIQGLLLAQADAMSTNQAVAPSSEHPALRQALANVEQAMKEADRERASRLADHAIPPSIPRTLWRIRNDLVLIGSALSTALPETIATSLAPATAALLRSHAVLAERCMIGLSTRTAVTHEDIEESYLAFTRTFHELRQSGAIRPLEFEEAGRIFGLAFALERLHRDFNDLTDRIGEIAAGKAERT
ncbi:FUSC family protein [Afipia sp. TerB]